VQTITLFVLIDLFEKNFTQPLMAEDAGLFTDGDNEACYFVALYRIHHDALLVEYLRRKRLQIVARQRPIHYGAERQ
jgi:hypothetical protein